MDIVTLAATGAEQPPNLTLVVIEVPVLPTQPAEDRWTATAQEPSARAASAALRWSSRFRTTSPHRRLSCSSDRPRSRVR